MSVFDEIDAVYKNRIQSNSVRNTVHDNVIVQLLAEIDGMVYLDNIHLIGATNIREAIHPAPLLPGGVEEVIKIELSDRDRSFCYFGYLYESTSVTELLMKMSTPTTSFVLPKEWAVSM